MIERSGRITNHSVSFCKRHGDQHQGFYVLYLSPEGQEKKPNWKDKKEEKQQDDREMDSVWCKINKSLGKHLTKNCLLKGWVSERTASQSSAAFGSLTSASCCPEAWPDHRPG
ncbi:hypothetical protein N7535_004679 [Penicillium sp. DV-2018c]|nr:hypothetical protein N7461_008260 [Penicillium sp. DV-2018c]KAJ5571019.1 hypothetical protein N7535_004679 [Penicillium sp. DV-2018c]